ncbi:hypothetical protein D3C71_809980 [compost metagenome]
MNLSVHHDLDAALPAVLRQGNATCIQQIGRSIGTWLRCGTHGTGQHQGGVVGPQVIQKHRGLFEGVGALGYHYPSGALFDLKLSPGQYVQQKLEIQGCTGQQAEGLNGDSGQRRQFRYGGQQGFAADGRDDAFTGIARLHAYRAAKCHDGQFGQVHGIPRLFVMKSGFIRF